MLNPFSFRSGPVTFWTTITYLALLIPIVIINEATPPAPGDSAPVPGINLTQAWLDLSIITKAYHPYNSRYNDVVRDFLLGRIHSILDENGVAWVDDSGASDSDAAVTVFDDMTSNSTMLMATSIVPNPNVAQAAAYFEGTNILVYIRGKADDPGSWWDNDDVHETRRNQNGLTLVNAHYDSVSTGYGATDDGMGVVSCLQLVQYFTHPDRKPERGIVVMFNNGEEDYLYGARALGQHPLNPYIHTFLNLEGAGAGGRANLFRTTDREVTAAYAGSPDPFGTIIGSDAFGLGFIRSATDYSILHDVYGQRGLDLAFFKPRARYHTNQDDARHASRGSLWHMLSASIHTVTQLSSDTGETFIGPRPDGAPGKVRNGSPSNGVWFDLFGKGFVLFGLRGMFAWSLTVLVATPSTLVLVTYILHRSDRYYFFSSSVKTNYGQPDDERVPVGGWKGFFRFPLALVVAGSLTLGAAFLMRKVNPFVIYSSRYSVAGSLAMMMSLFYFTFWAIMRGASFARPSALHRGYVNIWLFILGWATLVAVTVAEDRLRIGAGYMFVFLQSAVFLSTLIALCELFTLPKKAAWSQRVREDQVAREFLLDQPRSPLTHQESPAPPGTRGSNASASAFGPVPEPANQEDEDNDEDTEVPTERTPLVGGNAAGEHARTTFATTYRRSISALVDGARRNSDAGTEPFEHEQAWSGRLSSWTWILQFLLLGPFIIVLAGQTSLMLIDAVHQTGADGSSLLLPYLIVFLFTILLFLPLTPFIHRVTHHIPLFLAAVFVATLIYNLAAFPFSASSRYKAYFVQTLDLDSGENKVCYSGIEEYVRPIIAEMPSASGRRVTCGESKRSGLVNCCYDGAEVPPNLSGAKDGGYSSSHIVTVNATRAKGENRARIEVTANNTKACFLEFKTPVSGLDVRGSSGWDERFGQFPDEGIKSLKLWHRRWNVPWVVDVEWKGDDGDDGLGRSSGFEGTVVCMWSDANVPGTIPALDEALKFSPMWSAITKIGEGLVEGRKRFSV
ncbi:Peptide hydrolase [Madurella fahalii]|uniref:Peptide hydrolase n=1 Tax=Madurella fahalii TaxID=1157608 RepID=A0ABQ0GBA2_9PEZI